MSAVSPLFPSCSKTTVISRLRAAGCVFAEDEARLLISAATSELDLATMIDQRVAGLPLEHILGWAEFCGLRIAVGTGVFVPRHRTEFLARQAITLARASEFHDRTTVVYLCCGSGTVGAAMTAALDRIELHAVDITPAAVQCARRNLPVNAHVYEGDLYEPLPTTLRGTVNVLVANAPYVPTGMIGLLPPEARIHEPWVALDGGTDGLDVLRRVIFAAPDWLAPGGHLLVETSERQAERTAEIVLRSGLLPRVEHAEELDATVIIATRPSP
jgi:release factor glutamine methyltransferase